MAAIETCLMRICYSGVLCASGGQNGLGGGKAYQEDPFGQPAFEGGEVGGYVGHCKCLGD